MNTSKFCLKILCAKIYNCAPKLAIVSILLFSLSNTMLGGAYASSMVSVSTNDSVYTQVDVLPYLKGHKKSTSKELQKNALYPAIVKIKGIEDDVTVSFVVDEKGKVTNAKVERGNHAELDEEALRTVLSSGPWSPAQVEGKEVASRMTVLIRFKLTEDEKATAQALQPLDLENKPPLYVVDGRIIDGGVHTIDFYNVKSLRVIKGAKATALYGTRGSNGIVEVTTKSGTPPVK